MRTVLDIGIIVLLFGSILYALITEWRISDGKIVENNTYSFKSVFRRTIIAILVVALIAFSIYLLTNSIETATTLGIYFLASVICGCVLYLLLEYQTKRRGGRKTD